VRRFSLPLIICFKVISTVSSGSGLDQVTVNPLKDATALEAGEVISKADGGAMVVVLTNLLGSVTVTRYSAAG